MKYISSKKLKKFKYYRRKKSIEKSQNVKLKKYLIQNSKSFRSKNAQNVQNRGRKSQWNVEVKNVLKEKSKYARSKHFIEEKVEQY